jgi:Raf kinase inhibitor-like YbhB/YbcL family protein
VIPVRTLLALGGLALLLSTPLSAQRARGFRLFSSDVTAATPVGTRHVFNGFGCTGENVSPQLDWQGAPAGTKSFALMVHDPDAPTGSGWWHWVVYNIPAGTNALPAGAGAPGSANLPAGAVQGRTDFGSAGYGGPCPPPGRPHRYMFMLFALKVDRLDLPADATAALVGFNVRANALASTTLTVRYGR